MRTLANGLAVSVVVLLTLAPRLMAFVPMNLHGQYPANVAGSVMKWDLTAYPDGAIPYWINPTIPAGFTPFEPTSSPDVIVAKIHDAFRAWENVPTSKVKFRFAGFTDATKELDGKNVVSFSLASPRGGPIDWGCHSPAFSASPATGPAGVILPRTFPGQMLECDPTIHPAPAHRALAWWIGDTPPPNPGPGQRQGRVDLQGILTHEIGHGLGLDHTGTAQTATMTMWLSVGSGFQMRTLSTDDAIGISALYPEDEFLRSTGSIAGRVVREQDGSKVFGAHVVAMDAATGVIVAGGVTGLHETGADGMPRQFRRGSGEYLITGLPPGVYRVYTEPLDGPTTNWLGGIFGFGAEQQFMETDFTPSFFPQRVTVVAGQTVADVEFRVAARPQSAPNLDLQAWISDSGARVDPVFVRPGSTLVMELPPGENIVTDQGLAGIRIFFAGSGVTMTGRQARRTIFLSLEISPDALPGPRLLQVTTATGTAFLSGPLTVVAD